MAADAPALAVEGLTKSYGGRPALAGVTMQVRPGEIVGLLGPNGAGKSTLTKIACGLVRRGAGSARVCGSEAGGRAARARVGYLPELFRFPAWMTADEVLALHQELAGSHGGDGERTRLLALVRLEDRRDDEVGALSKGMQQRLGLAQALIGSPALLLLDEPTSGLDPAGRRVVREALATERDRGAGVLLNTHQLEDVERLCDRVAILHAGRVVAQGTPAGLAGAGSLEDAYLAAVGYEG